MKCPKTILANMSRRNFLIYTSMSSTLLWMLLAGHWVSFMRPLKENGYSTEESARMMYDLYVESLSKMPRENMEKRGEFMFTENYIDIMKNWTRKSKNQRADWVADFIPGDGKDFDYGIDDEIPPSRCGCSGRGNKILDSP